MLSRISLLGRKGDRGYLGIRGMDGTVEEGMMKLFEKKARARKTVRASLDLAPLVDWAVGIE